MEINPNESAFAKPEQWSGSFQLAKGSDGLTKREYIAIEMCKAILSNEELRMKIRQDRQHHAYVAIEYADQLIEQLNKPKTDEGNG